MANYLDDLQTFLNRATVVRAALAVDLAAIIDSGVDDPLPIAKQIVWNAQLSNGSADTNQTEELRLRLLTLLVDNFNLNDVPDPAGIVNLYQPVVDGNVTPSPSQWGMISGDINNQTDLIAYILAQTSFDADQPVVLSGSKSFGKYVNGDTAAWEGLTWGEAIIDSITEYLNPTFSSFAISGQSQQVEAYTIIAAGSKTFTFGITNSANATANSIVIVYVNGYGSGPVTLGTGLSTTSPHTLSLPTQIQIASGSRTFTITGSKAAPGSGTFTTSFVILYAFKNFYGTGVIPTDSAGVRSRSNTFEQTFSITITAGQTQVFFAYPSTHPNISNGSVIYVEGFNSSVGSTFGSPATIAVTQGDGVTTANYKVYSLTLPVAYPSTATYIVSVPSIP